jgi:RNA polymerase sigma-70 factor (ECF subfamily)
MGEPNTPLSASAERLLAERAASGDNVAVEALYDAYDQRLLGYCHRICRNPEDAADATQEAFCNVIQRLPGLDTANLNFAAYLFTAARNACMDIIKQRGRAEPTDEVPEDPFAQMPLETDPERSLLTGDQQRAAREANDRLPETQRTALALREVSELSYDEIAVTMNMNTNAVSQLISRARLNFDKQLRAGAVIVAPENEDDERAIQLTSARIDGKIDPKELSWLEAHLQASLGSRLNAEAIQESAALYRVIAPAGSVAGLKAATLEQATRITDASPSEGGGGSDDDHSDRGDGGPSDSTGFESTEHNSARRNAMLAAGAAVILVLALLLAGGEEDQAVGLDQTADAVAPADPTPTTTAAHGPTESDENKKQSDDDPQNTNSKVEASPQLAPGGSGASKKSGGGGHNNKSSAGDDSKSDKPANSDPPVTTPPAEEQPSTTTPTPDPPPKPPPKPPKLPPGPGTICGTPGCQTPTPPPVP